MAVESAQVYSQGKTYSAKKPYPVWIDWQNLLKNSMDAKDRAIVAQLQKNGRLTNQQLADAAELTPSPCLRRLRNLERRKIIQGYTAVIDETAYGLPITAFVRIRLREHTRQVVEAFEKKVRSLDNIVECHVLTGDFDYLLRVLVESLQDYERFVRSRLHGISDVAAIDTTFAYGVVKRSAVYPRVAG
jgi:DNA-binding Lrp family transcriptional regulator